LPDDEEIEQVSIDEAHGMDWDSLKYAKIYQEAFSDGAKWMRTIKLKRAVR